MPNDESGKSLMIDTTPSADSYSAHDLTVRILSGIGTTQRDLRLRHSMASPPTCAPSHSFSDEYHSDNIKNDRYDDSPLEASINVGAATFRSPRPASESGITPLLNRNDHQRRFFNRSPNVNSHDPKKVWHGDLILTNDMTLKDRQDAINQSHPFGIRLWKPALYKKRRGIENLSYRDIHESPRAIKEPNLWTIGNVWWGLCFGWWMALIYVLLSLIVLILSFGTSGGRKYSSLLFNMGGYLLWPFGKYVERRVAPTEPVDSSPHMQNHVASSSDFVDIEAQYLLSSEFENGPERGIPDHIDSACSVMRDPAASSVRSKWGKSFGLSTIIFYLLWFVVIAPLQLVVAALCWFLVLPIPMAKLNWTLLCALYHYPLSVHFANAHDSSAPHLSSSLPRDEIILCTYRATNLQYYKYTYDGINVIFINLLVVTLFALVDGFILAPLLNSTGVSDPIVVFCLCLVSVIPLSYFIGMAVASISSQSSFGLGAVINASFGSIVEIILYWLAITENKGVIVEGAIIGSILGCLLLLPGLSMICGGVGKWKEQRFNVKSAGVSTVLLIMGLICVFTPTLVYDLFGSKELRCTSCPQTFPTSASNASHLHPEMHLSLYCTGCHLQSPKNPGLDPFYLNNTRPLMYICAAVLPTAYFVGLLFTLRTHVHQIYSSEPSIASSSASDNASSSTLVPTAAVGATDPSVNSTQDLNSLQANADFMEAEKLAHSAMSIDAAVHTHDAPEWSKWKSALILLICTILFSLIAELLVDTVDGVISSANMDAKFIGLTLFALVPNVTEFMNAISFAAYGNVALSLEIGSAYVVQVTLIQIPLLVLFSAIWNASNGSPDTLDGSFTLIFPRWDVYVVFFSLFLISYAYIEGKSNYFKGTVLTIAYFVLISSFYFVS